MKKVGIADLKARLSQHLREVRKGRTLTVVDRNTPIARLVPYSAEGEPLTVQKPLGRVRTPGQVPLPPPMRLRTDVVELLLAERQVDR